MWIDKGNYWLSTEPQGTEKWLKQRLGRITASQAYSAIGYTERFLHDKMNPKPPNDFMIHGTVTEPEARDWYISRTGVQVEEVGIAVPKWNIRLGASADGLTSDGGIIEIKCPQSMYKNIVNYLKGPVGDMTDPNEVKKLVKPDHYAQIQLNLVVYERPWCDYIVYCTPENMAFTCRVPFDFEYCEIIKPQLEGVLPKVPIDGLEVPS